MPIGKSFYIKSVREEIEKVLASQLSDSHKRINVGQALFRLSKKYGIECANELVIEYQLEKIGINLAT